jgi:hypothetical protein
VSGLGEAFVALKNVMLLHERVERLQRELEGLARNQADLGSAVSGIDKRLARLEGFIEGAAAASAQQPKLTGG